MELLGSITLADISDGSDGKGINWLGDFNSHPADPSENDAYYNTTDRISYIYKNGAWSILAKDGQEGKNGQDGNTYSLNGSKGRIVRYKIKNNNDYKICYSPNIYSINATKREGDAAPVKLTNENYKLTLEITSILSADNVTEIEIVNTTDTNKYIEYDVENNNWNIYIQNIWEGYLNYLKGESVPEAVIKIGSALEREEIAFVFNLFIKDTSDNYYKILISPVSIDWSVSAALATLTTKADSIVAAVDESNLVFSADGLTITDGGFKINRTILDASGNKIPDTVLYIENNPDGTGNLVIKGKVQAESGYFSGELRAATGTFSGELKAATGTFSGELYAATGTFSGEITAQKGKLENIIIGNIDTGYIEISSFDKNTTKAGIFQYTKDGETNSYFSNFSIDLDGNVIAKSIILGKGTIGGMSFDDGRIYSNGWSITPDIATFNNIVAQGKITTAIFEQQKIQMCGGTFVFKDGISIVDRTITSEETGFIPEIKYGGDGSEKGGLTSDNLYLVTNNNRTNRFFAEYIEDKIVPIDSSSIVSDTYNLILDLGQKSDNNVPTDWIIGINSTSKNLSEAGLSSNSITLSEIELQNNKYNIKPRIILGKIPYGVISENSYETYGLYAESVYLTGTLTTKYSVENGYKYAGINTLNGAPFNITETQSGFNISSDGSSLVDNSRIIFWAGSEGTDEANIQKSSFQVSEKGTLYAEQAYFRNSVFSGANITASKIYAAEIIGLNDGAALTIKDSDIGINFLRSDSDDILMSLNSNAMELTIPINFNSSKNTIDIDNATISSDKIIISDSDINRTTIIDSNKINFYVNYLNNNSALESNYGDLSITTSVLDSIKSLNINYYQNGQRNIAMFNSSNIKLKTKLQLQDSLLIGDTENERFISEYKKVYSNGVYVGIDIYIEEIGESEISEVMFTDENDNILVDENDNTLVS